MLILAAMDIHNMIFWIFLLTIAVFISVAGIYYLIVNRRIFDRKNSALLEAAQSISELDRCDIANLDAIQASLNIPEFDLLSSAADRIVDDSSRLYQGKWISDPHKIFTLENLLTRSEYGSLAIEVPVQLFTLSIFASAIFWILSLSIFDTSNSSVMSASALPLLNGLIFSLLLFFTSYRQRNDLQRSMNYLAETISRRLPIFEDLAGTAVLIDSFVQYDREMAESVSILSETVHGLTHHELADLVAENVKVVMERDIAPTIQAAGQKLMSLSENLQARQENGMSELAGIFTQQLGAKLNHELTPLFLETDHLVEELHSTTNSYQDSIAALRQSREDSLSLQEQSRESLERLAEAREAWNEDMKNAHAALENLNGITENFNRIYSGESNALGQQVEHLSNEIAKLNENAREEMQNFASQMQAYTNQISEDMSRQNQSLQEGLAASNRDLIEGINSHKQLFSEEFQSYSDRFSDRLGDVIQVFEDKLNATVLSALNEMKALTENLATENRDMKQLLSEFGQGSSDMVSDILRLSQEMNRSADRMSQESNEIDESLKELNAKLETSVQTFSDSMTGSLSDSLDQLERFLGESVLRISSTSSQMLDQASRIADLFQAERALQALKNEQADAESESTDSKQV
ncbi:MAG: hypothetical protein Q4P72_04420 [Eubacteriales bacterium]|nr:hypothetical protein [Eubacteriales bacterium]